MFCEDGCVDTKPTLFAPGLGGSLMVAGARCNHPSPHTQSSRMPFAVFVYGSKDRPSIIKPTISFCLTLMLACQLRGQKEENPLWALPQEVKIEEVTLSLTRKRPDNPKPVVAVPTRGIVKVAVRNASTPPNPYHASLPAPSSSCCRGKIELYPTDQSGGMRHPSWSNRATRDRFPRTTVSFCGQAGPG